MKCVNCRKVIPKESITCEFCGVHQERPPAYYTVISVVLLLACLAYGITRIVLGQMNSSWEIIFRGALACFASFAFIPAFRFGGNAVVTILIKVFVIALVIVLI